LLAAFSITRTLRLEREATLRYGEIVKAREDLKELSARLVEAQENERRAISRELHDEVGQALSALLVELGNLSAALTSGSSDELREHVDTIKKLAENGVHNVRNMALLLRPSMLDDLGLVPALQWQAREVSKRTGMRVNVAAESVSDDLPEAHKTCVYRIVQEALNNSSRHAHANVVRVTVKQEPGRIFLTVQDDGKGFEPRLERGLGLLGMEERVSHLGGEFSVDSSPGHGALVTIVLPLA
jgi:signal transduction histidine kinase